MTTKSIVPQDEESITTLVWILEKAVHNEAFVAHTNLLKEHRFNMQRIKSQFPSKNHYSKSNAASTSSSSNIHRQRARPIKFDAFLPPKKATAFVGVNRFVGCTDPSLSFSAVTKYYEPPAFFVKDQHSDDRGIFKMPQLPPPITTPMRTNTITGSIESISSGYHSDGYPIGMSNIRKWLKSLRLHKYTWVFDNVSYEKMFTFTEEYLKSLSITQGASHKLAICIEKLKSRVDTMHQIELNLSQSQMYVPEAIYEMESMVLSPMKPMHFNCETDVGYRLWKLLDTVNIQIASNTYDDQTIQSFQRILESSINSEAFIDYTNILRDMRMKLTRFGRRMIR